MYVYAKLSNISVPYTKELLLCAGHFIGGLLASGEVFLWHKETETLRITAPLDAVAREVERELQKTLQDHDTNDRHKKLDGMKEMYTLAINHITYYHSYS